MANKDVHVSGNPSKGYKVQTSNTSKAAGLFKTQSEAINRAKEIATNKNSDVVVHRTTNGQIRSKDSYGNDPHPPKG